MRWFSTSGLLLLMLLLSACPGKGFQTSKQYPGPGAEAAGLPAASADSAADPAGAAAPAAGAVKDAGAAAPPADPAPAEDTVQLDESANGSTVTLKPGQRLEISLSSNPSTGFSWVLAEQQEDGQPYRLNQAVLKMLGRQYRPQGDKPDPLPEEPPAPDPPVPPVPPLPDEPQPDDPPGDPPLPGQPPDVPPGGPPGDAEPGEPQPPLVGAGGIEVWAFEAGVGGSAELRLEYRRSWERDVPAAASFILQVLVKAEEPQPPQPPAGI